MSRPARQVRTVRLHAPDERSIRRGALLLEDALHTASLPDAAGGRLLVVRSLACGTIRAGQSPASLALRIEQRMRQLSSTAVYAESAGAEAATAVYFHDAVEPYIRLALRLARQQSTGAWFWPLAVLGWSGQASPRDEALRLMLAGVAQTETGPAAVALLVATLHEHNAADSLLGALRWQDGSALLRASGYSAADTSAPWQREIEPSAPLVGDRRAPDAVDEPAVGATWRALLSQWIGVWGEQDARSLWLAHVALVAERPARLLDARLAQHARRLIRQISAPPIAQGSDITADQQPQRAQPTPDQADPAPVAVRAEPTTDALVTPAAAQRASTSTHATPTGATEPTSSIDSPWADLPRYSAFAGLFFTLPVLERLGITALLEHNPLLIELGMADLLLRTLALRLGSAPDDPALLALSMPFALTRSAHVQWVAPASWHEQVAASGPLLLRRGAGDRRVLYDQSGQLPLALWHGRAPAEVRPLLAGQIARRNTTLAVQSDLDLLCQAWLVALRRWCRRYAGLGLRELVCRPGRIVATRTHLDLVFDHRHADLRIRRAGLDIDPGWLPWFGRIVLFHYLYGES